MKLSNVQKSSRKSLSERLPVSYELIKVGYAVSAMNYDLETRRKFKLDDSKYYKAQKHKIVQINHISRIESAFKKYKEQGLIDYIYWLNNNNKSLQAKYDKIKIDQVSDDILSIAEKGAKGFWKNLIEFIFAFLRAFGSSK